jgi:hypothetical protein
MSEVGALSEKDREVLKRHAYKLRELAEKPEMKTRRQLWFKHNSLQPERPMVLAFPEGAWSEIITSDELECENSLMRSWEWQLKHRIYTAEVIKDDSIVEPWFNIGWEFDEGNFGVNTKKVYGQNRGSYIWEPPIKDISRDFHKLTFRQPSVNRELTYEKLNLAKEIFGDILPPRIRGTFWWSMGLTWKAIDLIGLENMMIYMYDDPDGLHRLMGWLRDEHANFINWVERQGLLTDMNEDDYTGSGGLGYTKELPKSERGIDDPVRLKDHWGFAESQETVGVSPTMFREFIFPYQLPLLEKFGLNCYGCCEPVDKRLEYILSIPNLRRLSVSPWADQKLLADKLGINYIFSRKPNPSLICVSFDEEVIRKDIRETLEIAGGGVLEIIMKDTHTVQGQPWRISRWVEIVREEIDKYMG